LAVAFIVWKRLPPPPAPQPTVPNAPAPARGVAIEDGTASDFSPGAAEIRATPADQTAINAALREMQEATKNISFEPPAKATP
jgi:hypothetical protein